MYKFDSQFRLGASLPDFDEKTVKDEPMLWSATPSFAYENGGPITKAFLKAALGPINAYQSWRRPYSGYDGAFCFDSRVHMLMPGWWPCIPGWHHDDVPRSRSDGQPDYDHPAYRAQHVLALVNGDIAPTEFAIGKTAMPKIPLFKEPVYKYWNGEVDLDIKDGTLERVAVPSNRLVHFDWQSFHRGTQAVKGGWRWFGRLTWDAGYVSGRPHHNEVRRQVQVYMQDPTTGW